MPFIRQINLRGLLSFPPDMEPFELQPLNVLIGPNGSGKSNLIKVLELLGATRTDFGAAIRAGGGAVEWLWNGENHAHAAQIDVEIDGEVMQTGRPIRYRLDFTETNNEVEVLKEVVEDAGSETERKEPHLSYCRDRGLSQIKMTTTPPSVWLTQQMSPPLNLKPDQSILKSIQDLDFPPECVELSRQFGRIRACRDWIFGLDSALPESQRTQDFLYKFQPDSGSLALALKEIQKQYDSKFSTAMRRFLPSYQGISIRRIGNTVRLYLEERGLKDPIPITRISEGTLRFLSMFVALHTPNPPSLLCIEEPERGMHPDVIFLLANLLVEASSRMQLVVTTHSDALLSGLGDHVESVLVCENNGHGTTIDRLDAKDLEFWLDDHTLGDIWRIGAIGGNP